MSIDIDFVRAQFPAFSQACFEGQAFFENADGSFTCQQVINRLNRFYLERKVQPYSAYGASRLAGQEMDEARTRLARFLGVTPEEVSFGPSTTQNTYVLAQAFGQMLDIGDAIIVTNQDHEANSGAWRKLAASGIEVREWCIDTDSGHLPPQGLKALLDDKVKLVCFPHCSNIVAEINPVADLCKLIREAGAYSCIDGVSYAPHGLPDVGKLGADIYLFSSYKTYGPHQGIMTIRQELSEKLPHQCHDFNAASPYKRFTPAGPDHAQIAACAGIADYLDALYDHHYGHQLDGDDTGTERGRIVHDLMREQETKLLQPLLDYVSQKNSVRLLGPNLAEERAPTVAMVVSEPGAVAAAKLAEKGIMASGGSFYSNRCLEAQGVDLSSGVLRVSFVHYTSEAEVNALIKALDAIL